MTNLSIFQFHDNQLNTLTNNNEVWFLANDICKILDFKNPRTAVSNHCKPWGVLKQDTPTISGTQSMIYINEPNLYRLIVKSRKPEAEEFERKVFEEILPSIRKTGSYSLTVNEEQQYLISKAVDERVHRTGEKHQAVYHKFYDQFKITSYKNLPASKFNDAIEFLGGVHVKSLQFTDDELCTLSWCYKAAERMRQHIRLVSDSLHGMKSEYAPSFHSMGIEYARTLENARVLLERETNHIDPRGQGYLTNNWQNVLPNIRKLSLSV